MSDPVEGLATLVVWRGERLPFLYLIDQWRIVQRELGVGPWVLEARLTAKVCSADEVRATLRIGLVGAGMAMAEAEALVTRNCDARPGMLDDALVTALIAVTGSLHGLEADIEGESGAVERAPKTRSRTGRSRSPAS